MKLMFLKLLAWLNRPSEVTGWRDAAYRCGTTAVVLFGTGMVVLLLTGGALDTHRPYNPPAHAWHLEPVVTR